MYNELDFLIHIPVLNNDDNRDTIYNWVRGGVTMNDKGNIVGKDDPGNTTVIFKSKDVNNTETIKNYYKDTMASDTSNNNGESDINPYLKLIRDFSTTKDGKENVAFKAMKFQAADFTYLTDLGVYPINRMWVLRRFGDNVIVPGKNLQEWEGNDPVEPMYTMVGWIEPEKEDFFEISFNENWEVITDRLDQLVVKILKDEFGFDALNVVPVPGWSQGLMFGFLKEMGITQYDLDHIPQGDPSVLQEAAARAVDANPGFGNKSTMSLSLKTSYEQKFIGDIDPGSAMMDIIQNCIYMSTRDTKFVFGESPILSTLRNAVNSNDPGAWWTFISTVISAFITAVGKVGKSLGVGIGDTGTPVANPGAAILSIARSILTSTVGKWRWALRGSLGLMTGENTTPWHITLGNPYSPFVTLGNVKVTNMSLSFDNEFAYNDIPTKLNVEIKVDLGRNLGAQEIFRMFNNGYQRIYTPPTPSNGSGENIKSGEQTQEQKDVTNANSSTKNN